MLQDRKPIGRHSGEPPSSIVDHQAENQLRYIRDVMSRATTFTAVPGKGMVLMGIVALAASAIALNQHESYRWILAWAGAVVLAPAIGLPHWCERHAGPVRL